MSFQDNVLWMPKEDGCLTDGEISYDVVSKVDPKRRPQWFMDGEAALLPTKKQALEVSSGSLFDGIPASTLPPWGNVPGFCSEPSQITEQLFNNDASKDPSFHERNIASMSMGISQMGRNTIDDPFESNALFGLSMSHSLEDPKAGINYDVIRKRKVSEVRDPENLLSMPGGSSFTREANNGMSSSHINGKVDGSSISTRLRYDQEQDNVASLGHSYARKNDTFVSIDQSYINNACDAFAMGNSYKADGSNIQMTNSFSETDCNIMQMAGQISKVDDNDIMSIRHTYKGDRSVTTTQDYNKGDSLTTEIAPSNSNCERYALSMGQSFSKGEGSIICFGGYNDDGTDDPGRLVCSYDLLIARPSVQRSSSSNQKDLDVSNGNAALVSAQVIASGVEGTFRKKEDTKSTKKTPPNNFPSNVRSLLSTGILDEVPVKYIAWSREKELRGIIKGSGYLCGCQPCNFSKVINAYEFERHAGCKTKHPNNHIYFENGKTIYGIVQELRNTPQNMLFDVIQTITGSPINQKSFHLWKESFLAATRELQRIYGKDERQHLS